jgi:hypothetical protein
MIRMDGLLLAWFSEKLTGQSAFILKQDILDLGCEDDFFRQAPLPFRDYRWDRCRGWVTLQCDGQSTSIGQDKIATGD